MNENQKAAYIMAQAANLNATVAGMVAANMQRAVCGNSMAYVQSDFIEAIERSGCTYNQVMEYFRS